MKQDAFNKVIKRSAGPAERSVCECVWEAFICTKYEDTHVRAETKRSPHSCTQQSVRRRRLLSQPDTNGCSSADMLLNYSGVKGGVPHHHTTTAGFSRLYVPYYLLHV